MHAVWSGVEWSGVAIRSWTRPASQEPVAGRGVGFVG
jgi:hypothetical protein